MRELKLRLEMSADVVFEWFRNNNMQANPSKFQGIVIARGNDVATPVTFNIKDIDTCEWKCQSTRDSFWW